MSQIVDVLQNEILYLRRENAELKDRLMALVGDALQKFQSKELMNQPIQAPSYMDEFGKIVKMEETNEEEKKQKIQAVSDYRAIMGN